MVLSLIKKIFRFSSNKKSNNFLPKEIQIPREKHRVSKTNISPNALKVINKLHHAGFDAYLVGGGVRDLALGHLPKDFDVATNAHPKEVYRLFRGSMLIGHRFRIVHVPFGREVIEVTTFRASEDKSKTRHKDSHGMILQDNIYGTISQDACRRDFTVNALYYNPENSTIVDFTGGYEDLQKKVIRLIGEPTIRYQEDPVRMLRAIRFSAKLNCEIAPETAKPIASLGPLLKKIPSARLSEEIFKVYHNGASLRGHELLQEYNLLGLLFPQTDAYLKNNPKETALIESSLENTDQRVADGRPIMPSFLIATLLWQPLQEKVKHYINTGDAPLNAVEKAMAHVIHEQNEVVAIPKRHWQVVREVWFLQYHFPRRLGPRPFRLLTHPRFRAAYDFLLLRAIAKEIPLALAEWWTTFQEVDRKEQEQMIKAINKKRNVKKLPQSD